MKSMSPIINPIHREMFVSVERATQLQTMSMVKFQAEAAKEQKLGRILGHVSINRRSTEIMKTAVFEEEMMAEVEADLYDEDAEMYDAEMYDAITSDIELSPPSPRLGSFSDDENDNQWGLPLPAQEIDVNPTEPSIISAAERYLPTLTDATPLTTHAETLLAMEENWMYDVLDLHIDYDALTQPSPLKHSFSIDPIQLWRIVLESLARLTKRDSLADSTSDIRQLEAYGFAKPDQPLGLGLHYNQEYGPYGTPIPLVT